jgi:hypothetical protein
LGNFEAVGDHWRDRLADYLRDRTGVLDHLNVVEREDSLGMEPPLVHCRVSLGVGHALEDDTEVVDVSEVHAEAGRERPRDTRLADTRRAADEHDVGDAVPTIGHAQNGTH